MPNPETSSQSKQDARKPEPLAGVPPKPVIRGVPPAPPVPDGFYKVRKGDTLYSIAKQHGTTVEKLKKLNGFSDKAASNLKVGQKIRIQ